MTSQYNIIIKNMSSSTMSFYVFQKQSSFTNAGSSPSVISSSLASGTLYPYSSYGSQLGFSFDAQVYVGAKSNNTASYSSTFNAKISLASAANTVSETSAVQPIDLTTSTAGASVNNFSNLSISPLGLSAAFYQSGLTAGSFGIQVPSYSPSASLKLYFGNAVINQDGSIILSSFVTPPPSGQPCCSPQAIYYVKVGSQAAGQVITYDTSNTGLCDFTTGYSTISVQYNSNGTYSTSGT